MKNNSPPVPLSRDMSYHAPRITHPRPFSCEGREELPFLELSTHATNVFDDCGGGCWLRRGC